MVRDVLAYYSLSTIFIVHLFFIHNGEYENILATIISRITVLFAHGCTVLVSTHLPDGKSIHAEGRGMAVKSISKPALSSFQCF